jgi:glycosyltransferase involved in cell wall biosynthesis
VIDLVLPCLDEEAALPGLLSTVPAGVRPIVVDNGSTDASVSVARKLGAVVVECRRRGYGAACHTGLLAAGSDVVAFCDCDGSIDPGCIPAMGKLVRQGTADLVTGRRRPTTWRAWPVHARIANAALSWRLRRAGAPVHDVGPVRVARRVDLLDLALQDRRSGYSLETLLLAARAGWRIAEQDVEYHPRAGRSKVTGTARGTLQAMRDMSVVLGR